MQVVKLNGRYKQYRDYKHTVGLKFDVFDREAADIEQVCRDLFKVSGWRCDSVWSGYFGSRKGSSRNPYWITFRNETDLTMVLLMLKKE